MAHHHSLESSEQFTDLSISLFSRTEKKIKEIKKLREKKEDDGNAELRFIYLSLSPPNVEQGSVPSLCCDVL